MGWINDFSQFMRSSMAEFSMLLVNSSKLLALPRVCVSSEVSPEVKVDLKNDRVEVTISSGPSEGLCDCPSLGELSDLEKSRGVKTVPSLASSIPLELAGINIGQTNEHFQEVRNVCTMVSKSSSFTMVGHELAGAEIVTTHSGIWATFLR